MGYDPEFILGFDVPLPVLGPKAIKASFANGRVLDHSRFSLVLNQERGFAIYTAHNIDGARLLPRGSIKRRDNFRVDPQINPGFQVDDRRGYKNNPWDRGHLVRRAAMHWGDLDEAKLADSETFFWTNIAPQHNRLHHGAWGKIENWMVELADSQKKQVNIFTGPIFTSDDVLHQNEADEAPIRIPAGFWKVLVINSELKLKAAGFLVWQFDYEKEKPVAFDPHLEQVRITTLENIIGLSFGTLHNVDPMLFVPIEKGLEIEETRGGRFVLDKGDIIL